MGSRAGSSLPFLIVSHEAVVVRAEEWLTMKKDSRYGDNFAEKRERGGVRIVRLEKGESSSSVAGPLASSAAAAAKLLDVEMMSEETSHPLSPSYKLDGQCGCISLLSVLRLRHFLVILPRFLSGVSSYLHFVLIFVDVKLSEVEVVLHGMFFLSLACNYCFGCRFVRFMCVMGVFFHVAS